MKDSSQHRQSRSLLVICLAIMLLYAASHAYHFWHIRLRFTTGTFLRSVMELAQAPMILSRMFAPFIGGIAAIWFIAKDARRTLGAVVLAIMAGGCFVSFPYVCRFVAAIR